jgi:hypothetical protein
VQVIAYEQSLIRHGTRYGVPSRALAPQGWTLTSSQQDAAVVPTACRAVEFCSCWDSPGPWGVQDAHLHSLPVLYWSVE